MVVDGEWGVGSFGKIRASNGEVRGLLGLMGLTTARSEGSSYMTHGAERRWSKVVKSHQFYGHGSRDLFLGGDFHGRIYTGVLTVDM
jgi:hypothetical protein